MKPLTRKEFFMAKAAGQTVPDLEPITREEYFLNQIAENGGGGGSSDPYAGYDVVIKGEPGIDETVWSLIKGSYEDASTLYEAGKPLNAFVYQIGDLNDILSYVSSSYMSVEDEILNIFITIWDIQSAVMTLQLLSNNTVVYAT